jgi:hypothetical protein
VDRMNRRKFGFVERQEQRIFVDFQQVLSDVTNNGICSNEVSARIKPSLNSSSGMRRWRTRLRTNCMHIVEFPSRGALLLFHHGLSFPFPEDVVNARWETPGAMWRRTRPARLPPRAP